MSKKMKYLFSKSDCFKYSLYLCRKYHSRISIMATVNKAILLGYVGKDPDLIYVEGKIQSRSYDDRQGITRYITEIWADDLKLFTPKGEKVEN